MKGKHEYKKYEKERQLDIEKESIEKNRGIVEKQQNEVRVKVLQEKEKYKEAWNEQREEKLKHKI